MSNELVAQNETALAAPGMFDSLEEMERSLKIAERLSQSNILPETFKGKAGDVLIALDMAQRLRMNPLMVMQGIVIVHGRPTFSGQFYGALITAGGRFAYYDYIETETDEPVKELGGIKNRIGKIVAVRPNGDKVEGPEVSFKMAVKEGWATRSGSKWQTMPALMLRYRAASFFVRTCCPEAAMGLYEENEQADIPVKAERPEETVAPRVRAIVETEVFKDVKTPDASDAQDADVWTADDLYTWYSEKIVNSKTTKELETHGKAIKGLNLPKNLLDQLRELYLQQKDKVKVSRAIG